MKKMANDTTTGIKMPKTDRTHREMGTRMHVASNPSKLQNGKLDKTKTPESGLP
jgi:hypothetical protein